MCLGSIKRNKDSSTVSLGTEQCHVVGVNMKRLLSCEEPFFVCFFCNLYFLFFFLPDNGTKMGWD